MNGPRENQSLATSIAKNQIAVGEERLGPYRRKFLNCVAGFQIKHDVSSGLTMRLRDGVRRKEGEQGDDGGLNLRGSDLELHPLFFLIS
jgi:hypothetical protein